jgi:D-beta-D-heptose 7-phosphate kinase / D-beta-D-heptose 1-phosphate adenosyltransferase
VEKNLPPNELVEVIQRAQRCGKVVVFTNGCFDLLHPGHIHLLSSARKLGDILVVAANSDTSIRRLKGLSRPIFCQRDRISMLEALTSVDYVVVFNEDTPIPLLKILKPDILVKGDQYSLEEVVGHDVVSSYGGRVERVKVVDGFSTTEIVRRLSASDS